MTSPDRSDPVEHDGRDRGDADETADAAPSKASKASGDSVDSGDSGATGDTAGVEPDPEPNWVRRRRLDAVFGDGAHGQALGDRWYRDQVPPHHG